jgi:predicted SprT family Zn-dependent metalloprotease
MELKQAEQLVCELMTKWDVNHVPFKWNRGKRMLGCVRATRNRITGEVTIKSLELSREFVRNNDEAAVRDTILHEIAHVLAGPQAKHGPAWQAQCIRLGCRPKQYATTQDVVLKHSHALTCGCCGQIFKRLFRASSKDYSRCHCGTCGRGASIGQIKVVKIV